MEHLQRAGALATALSKLSNLEQRNAVEAIKSIYGCRVTVYSPKLFAMTMGTDKKPGALTSDEQKELIDWVMRLHC